MSIIGVSLNRPTGSQYVNALLLMLYKTGRRFSKAGFSGGCRDLIRTGIDQIDTASSPVNFAHSLNAATSPRFIASACSERKKLSELPFSEYELVLYFSAPLQRSRILQGLDRIWQNEYLFRDDGASKAKYIQYLKQIAQANQSYFCRVSSEGYSNQCFVSAFLDLADNHTLDETTKLICLTQALELALMQVDVASVLKKINENTGHSKERVASLNLNDDDRTMGYRQELLAGWYFAKFHYPDLDRYNEPYRIRISVVYPNKYNHCQVGNKYKEVDLVLPNGLGEVKHVFARSQKPIKFALEAEILFKFVINSDEKYGFRDSIKYLILISGSNDPQTWSRQYNTDLIVHEVVQRDFVEKKRDSLSPMDKEFQMKFARRKNQVVVLYIASVKNNSAVRNWVQTVYKEHREKAILAA